jgi:transcription elongation factor Elf1
MEQTNTAIIRCARCGHRATLPEVADLTGKTLVCSRCGQRQSLSLAQVIDTIYREEGGLKR